MADLGSLEMYFPDTKFIWFSPYREGARLNNYTYIGNTVNIIFSIYFIMIDMFLVFMFRVQEST